MKKSKFKNVLLERIPCPIDPSHSIYKHNLLLHSKICNIRTRQLEMREEEFYCLNCNSGNNKSNSDNNNNSNINHNDNDNNNSNNNNDNNNIHHDNNSNNNNNNNNNNDNNNKINHNASNSNNNNNNNNNNNDNDNNNDNNNNDVSAVEDDVIASTVNPDSLLIKIKECYLRMEQSKELSFLNNNFKTSKKEKNDNLEVKNEKKKENIIIDNHDGKEGNHNDHTLLDTQHNTTHSMSDESYKVLEDRVVAAVSGNQVAFDRIRHAQQDAMIVRYVFESSRNIKGRCYVKFFH